MERAPVSNPAALPPGTVVGAWRVLGQRARGSYGAVYLAQRVGDADAGTFALKLALHPKDPRFACEVELLSRIHHPHVPSLHDSGEWRSSRGDLFPFLIMSWVEGLPLYSWARVHRPSSRQVLRLLAQIARALQATHEAGGFHRDVKGDNVLVRSDGHAVLADFGSCTWRGAPVLTRQSHPPGTSQYWSPQSQLHLWRFRRHEFTRYEATTEDDVYALGVTAYRLVTGRYPLTVDEPETEGDDSFSRFPALVPADELVELSPELARWIRQMLSEKPSARGSALEVALGLELAADTAGREADRPIAPRTEPRQGAREAPPAPAIQSPAWPRWLAATAMSAALALGAWGVLQVLQAARVGARAAESAAQEGGTTSLGEAVLAEPVSSPEPVSTQAGLGAKVPRQPLPGQRLPPCKRPQVEINSGCWIRVADESPPCVQSTYEWKDSCYWPAFGPSNPATSGHR